MCPRLRRWSPPTVPDRPALAASPPVCLALPPRVRLRPTRLPSPLSPALYRPVALNVCQFVDVYATGGVVPNVTATLSSAWASFNDIAFVQTLNLGNLITTGVLNQPPAPGGLPVKHLGFPICVNQSLSPQGAGTVTTNITIQGSGVGTITIPVTFITSPNSPGAANFKQIGIFRNSIAGLGAGFVLDSNTTGANYTTATTGPSGSSAIRENCLLSHTTATCLAETIEEGLTDHALRQRITASAGAIDRKSTRLNSSHLG